VTATGRVSFRSMGTDVELIGPADDPDLAAAAAIVRGTFEREDRRFSRFRADSELSDVNRRAGRATAVSPAFAEVVALALEGAERTDGRFDPTLLDAVIAAGYDRDFDELLAGARVAARPGRPGGRWREIVLEGTTLTLPPGVGVDLGGIAKGWTVDRAALGAVVSGSPWALVNAGGDLRIAGDAPEDLEVAIEDPEDASAELGRLRLSTGALATTSVTKRAWGEGLHHLIDPRTGLPAAGAVLQATVWAPSCAEAEVSAKAALLDGERFLERGAALLVLRDGRIVTNLGDGLRQEVSVS
jgi:FAD:protein FMN transferase